MIHCPNCSSTDIVVKEAYDDGDDHIDVEIHCNACEQYSTTTVSQEDLDKYDWEED